MSQSKSLKTDKELVWKKLSTPASAYSQSFWNPSGISEAVTREELIAACRKIGYTEEMIDRLMDGM